MKISVADSGVSVARVLNYGSMAKGAGDPKGKAERVVSAQDSTPTTFTGKRPEKLEDFVGQRRIVENLQVMLDAARQRNVPLEHILFSGPPGLGKTTLAHILAREMDSQLVTTTGPLLERAGDLVAILTSLKEKQTLFIDEVHRLARPVEETLYGAMEDFKVDIVIGKGPGAKTIPLKLNRFTLIAATTRSGLLTAPLRDRFGALFHLSFYEPLELLEILKRKVNEHGINADESALLAIAQRARGTPRVALRLLKRVWDFQVVSGAGKISEQVAVDALNQLGISEEGLDEMDRRILLTIIKNFQGGPVGIESIAAVLNEERDTIEDVYEPFLMKAGFLEKTPRGRVATGKAYEYFKVQCEPPRVSFGGEERLFEE